MPDGRRSSAFADYVIGPAWLTSIVGPGLSRFMSIAENRGREIVSRIDPFVTMLSKLTEAKKVQWAQSEREPGFVYCMLGDEFIVFELYGDSGERVSPSVSISAISSICRNVRYVWQPFDNNWDILLQLLRSAPLDHKKIVGYRQVTIDLPMKILDRMIEV